MAARPSKRSASARPKARTSDAEPPAAKRIAALLAENARLAAAVEALEREAKRYYERYVEAQVKGASVATLYVASSRLRASIDRAEVVAAIEEIVVGLVGSEEMVLYETTDDGSTLVPTSWLGIEPTDTPALRMGEGTIGGAASTGETWIAIDSTTPSTVADLSACVPLRIGHAAVGAVAIFRMLEHKRSLEPVDRELFALLSTQAAMALLCAKLAARASRSTDSSPDATRART
jgi:K+-sensing histidine kinase KdpD